MAKRPAMGKGLGALLGSSGAQKKGSTLSDTDAGSGKPESPEGKTPDETKQPAEPESNSSVKPVQPSDSKVDNPAGSPAESSSEAPAETIQEKAEAATDRLVMLPVDRIRRGVWQPRQQFGSQALQELADSLKEQGMIQPILVRRFADGYELVAGERRWRAAQLAGLHEIPAIIRDLDDQDVAASALIENIQREDLNAIEEAQALQRLQLEFDMTHQDLAEAVGRSRAAVSNLIRLLDLHDEVKLMLEKGDLEMGHARALLSLDRHQQLALAQEVVRKGLSVRATENQVRRLQQGTKRTAPGKKDPDIVALEKRLGDKLGATVSISHRANGAGRLQIAYTSSDELQGILDRIK